MNQRQSTILALAKNLNTNEFATWFEPSEIMAFVDVESSFRAHAYRYEPALREGSYGLMQVLASTAASVMHLPSFDPESMYDPAIGLRVGMTVAKSYWEQLAHKLGQDPSDEEWAASYNEGVGGVLRDDAKGREPDPAYTAKWIRQRDYWIAQGVDKDE